MQIKTIMRYYLTQVRMANKNLQINAGKSVEKRNLLILLVGILVGAATMENSMQLPQKTRMLIYDSVIPLLDIYPNKTVIQKGTCTPCS